MQNTSIKLGPKELLRRASLFGLALGTGLYWIIQGLAALDFTIEARGDLNPTYLNDTILRITEIQVIAVLLLAAAALLVTLLVTVGQKRIILLTSLVFIGFCAGSALVAERLINLYVSSI